MNLRPIYLCLWLMLLVAGCKKKNEPAPIPETPDYALNASGNYFGSLQLGSSLLKNVTCTVVRTDKNRITITVQTAVETLIFSEQYVTGEGSCKISGTISDLNFRGTASFDAQNFVIDSNYGRGSQLISAFKYNGRK